MSRSVPEGLDVSVAHNARVWNYWLGGKDNYGSDRAVGDQVVGMFPGVVDVARADRAFLGRVVRHLTAEVGVDQFLDIGTGLPTADNTHQVAQRINPAARIVYVDNDPLVLVHARALLASHPEGVTSYVDADVHDPAAIVAAAGDTIDFGRPVAVMMLGVLNFVLDTGQAGHIVRDLMASVSAGSYLAVTHPTLELGGEANTEAMRFWNEHATPPIVTRSRDEVIGFFDGLELLEPGVVSCSRWRPERNDLGLEPPEVAQFGALGYRA